MANILDVRNNLGVSKMTISSNGNIGIGCSPPSARFHIGGNKKAQSQHISYKIWLLLQPRIKFYKEYWL